MRSKYKKPRARRPNRKRRYRGSKKAVKKKGMVTVYRPISSSPLAPLYRTKLITSGYGSISSGDDAAGYAVKLNSAYLPMLSTGGSVTLPNYFPAVATQTPVGYSQLINLNMYTRCRVLACKIEFEIFPESILDTVNVAINPTGTLANPATLSAAMNQPFSKHMLMGAAKVGKRHVIKNYITIADWYGVTREAFNNDLSGLYSHIYNNNPTNLLYWVIQWGTPDTDVLVADINYTFKMTQYVEAFGISNNTVTMT